MTGTSDPNTLRGKRILVTRPRAQSAELCDRLAELGAQPILFSTIQILPLEDSGPLDRAIAALDRYQWAVFTSANGVAAFWERLGATEAGLPPTLRVAAIGPATAAALARRGVQVEFTPEEYVAEAIAAGLAVRAGERVLLPRADIARKALAVELARRGALVDEIAAYRTAPARPGAAALAELRRGVDAITFTSSSTAQGFAAATDEQDRARLAGDVAGRPVIACIGPITAQTVRDLGLPVDVVAAEYTSSGLIAALQTCFSQAQAKEQ